MIQAEVKINSKLTLNPAGVIGKLTALARLAPELYVRIMSPQVGVETFGLV